MTTTTTTTAHQQPERRPDASQWGEAMIRIDMCDRKAADICEELLHAYEGRAEWDLADAWCAKVVEKSQDARQIGKLKQEAQSRLHRLSQPPRHTPVSTGVPTAVPSVTEASAAVEAPIEESVEEVREKPRSKPKPRWDIRNAPLSNDEVQRLGPILRAVFGFAMIAYSNIATTLIVGWFLSPVLPKLIWEASYAHLIGLLLGLSVTIGQWVTKHPYPRVHWMLVLLLDAPFSGWQTFTWLSAAVAAHSGGKLSNDALGICIAISLAGGVTTAKFGELLLLGYKKRKG